MDLQRLLSLRILLASQSPRRLQLLQQMGFGVERVNVEVEERLDLSLADYEMTLRLAKQKSLAYTLPIEPNSVLVTADTLVFAGGRPLGKPKDEEQAADFLRLLSASTHKVITSCCLRSQTESRLFYQTANVRFCSLSEEQIEYYISTYRPFDKAGAYGIQEWIGLTGIESIEGDYYTIMGLPCQKLFSTLLDMNV